MIETKPEIIEKVCCCVFDENNNLKTACPIHIVWLQEEVKKKESERKLKEGGW